MSSESNNPALSPSHQMLELSQQLALLQMIERVGKYLEDGVEKSQISLLLDALGDCRSASKNPREATATFLNAIALFTEWEEKELQ